MLVSRQLVRRCRVWDERLGPFGVRSIGVRVVLAVVDGESMVGMG